MLSLYSEYCAMVCLMLTRASSQTLKRWSQIEFLRVDFWS